MHAWVIAVVVVVVSASSVRADTPHSPRLDALAAAPSTANVFWARLATEGTPIVEDVGDSRGRLLVTFVYRAKPGITHVAAYGVPSGDNGNYARLARVKGTDAFAWSVLLEPSARFTYRLAPGDDFGPPSNQPDPYRDERHKLQRLDALNPHVQSSMAGTPSSLVELPAAPKDPWRTVRRDVPTGTLVAHALTSKALSSPRTIHVYTPPGFSTSHAPYPLVVMTDAQVVVPMFDLTIQLDNLIADKRIPPCVVAMIETPETPDRGRRTAARRGVRRFRRARRRAVAAPHVSSDERSQAHRGRRPQPRRDRGGVRGVSASRGLRQRDLAIGLVLVEQRRSVRRCRTTRARVRDARAPARAVLARGRSLRRCRTGHDDDRGESALPRDARRARLRRLVSRVRRRPRRAALADLDRRCVDRDARRTAAFDRSAAARRRLARRAGSSSREDDVLVRAYRMAVLDGGAAAIAWLEQHDTTKLDPLVELEFRLYYGGHVDAAMPIAEWTAKHYPKEWNAFDTLGEGYARLGNRSHAITAYERAVALAPKKDGDNARVMLDYLRDKP